MSSQQTPDANAFNDWTETESASLAPPPLTAHEAVETTEVPAKKAPRPPKTPMGKKQRMMVLGGLAFAAIVAFALLGRNESPPPYQDDDVAAIIATAHQMPGENPAGDGVFQDVTPVEPEQDPTLAALNDISGGDDWISQMSADAAEIAVPAQESASIPAVIDPSPEMPVASTPSPAATVMADTSGELAEARRRIEALQGDLKRAQAARRVAERNQRTTTTIIAVLEDGVVIRDDRGREKVLGVGEKVNL